MGKIIMNTTIKREKGKIYYCGTDANGNLTVCEALMAHGKRKK